jgi:hypothetical protein
MAGSSFRMPLQTGASALRHLLWGSMAFIPGYVVALFALAAFPLWPELGGIWVCLAVGGVLLIAFGAGHLARAFRDRPSDLLLDAEGVRLEGGPHEVSYGLVVPWSELQRESWRVRRVESVSELVTGEADVEIVLAHATEWDEIRSLETIAETVRYTALHRSGASRAAPTVTTIACPGCGAPLRADDVETIQCPYCARPVAIPAPTRERIRAARRLGTSQRVTPRLIARFLNQPSARRANLMGLAAAVLMLATWPLAITFGDSMYERDRLGVLATVALLLLPPMSIWLLAAIATTVISGRRALQLVGLRLSARSNPAGQLECRLCGATLTASRDLVVACGYCGAPNVLGVDLRREARDAVSDEEELLQALAINGDRRKWALTNVAISLGFTAAAMLLLAVGCIAG